MKTTDHSHVVHHVLHPGSPIAERTRKKPIIIPIERRLVAERGDLQYRMGAVPTIMKIDRPRGHSIFIREINAAAASGSPVDSEIYLRGIEV